MPSLRILQAGAPQFDLLVRAREVVEIEARTLDRLAASLGTSFEDACKLMFAAKGRIIVSGIGKSGHIGRKIASTLAATGTPALYVHPGEAAHGDLGMVLQDDVILAISNSGNTLELQVLYDHARRLGIKIVGVTSIRGSVLERSSDICILIPQVREACWSNVAPTSSTTQQLALGDAIAMVLMDMRSLTWDSVKGFHPGGMIGLRFASVGQLMHGPEKMPLVALDLSMDQVISRMTMLGFGIAGVVDGEHRLVGTITDGDLRRHFNALERVRARDVMTTSPKVLRSSMAAEDALRFLNDSQITCAFVMADEPDPGSCSVSDEGPAPGRETPIGIIHIHDFLRRGLV